MSEPVYHRAHIVVFDPIQTQRLKLKSTKRQTPNTKKTPNTNLQDKSADRNLEFEAWDFFGVWFLVFDVFANPL
jgi:hypothetical protein